MNGCRMVYVLSLHVENKTAIQSNFKLILNDFYFSFKLKKF